MDTHFCPLSPPAPSLSAARAELEGVDRYLHGAIAKGHAVSLEALRESIAIALRHLTVVQDGPAEPLEPPEGFALYLDHCPLLFDLHGFVEGLYELEALNKFIARRNGKEEGASQ